MIPRLVVASKNRDKVAEIEALIDGTGLAGEVVRELEWPDVEETGETLEENALLKARSVAEITGLPALGDDTGLEVAALGGLPGVRTARYAGPSATYSDNVELMLEELSDVVDRRARFRSVVALVFPDGQELTAEGEVEGSIATSPRGVGVFGYDPIFEVGGRTLAEMESGEKNALSHRGRAVEALLRSLGL